MSENKTDPTLKAKESLDKIIDKARVHMYKPIQIAEVLYHSRIKDVNMDIQDFNTFKIESLRWRDEICMRLLGRRSTSSMQYQHNVWADNAMPKEPLVVLDTANKATNGGVENYIYRCFQIRQKAVSEMIVLLENTSPESFRLEQLLEKFERVAGITRSIDKAYEIVVYSLFETIVTGLEAKVTVSISENKSDLLKEFAELVEYLLGIDVNETSHTIDAHIYRVGVTNAADRGLDMWANFGPAVQVKHLTLNPKSANDIIDQIESDHIVVVCRAIEKKSIATLLQQISWKNRVRGIVTEKNLIEWYDKCLRGKHKEQLAKGLMVTLLNGFIDEFPQAVPNQTAETAKFLRSRNYDEIDVPPLWDAYSKEKSATSKKKREPKNRKSAAMG